MYNYEKSKGRQFFEKDINTSPLNSGNLNNQNPYANSDVYMVHLLNWRHVLGQEVEN
jgi:hypothetical protein